MTSPFCLLSASTFGLARMVVSVTASSADRNMAMLFVTRPTLKPLGTELENVLPVPTLERFLLPTGALPLSIPAPVIWPIELVMLEKSTPPTTWKSTPSALSSLRAAIDFQKDLADLLKIVGIVGDDNDVLGGM